MLNDGNGSLLTTIYPFGNNKDKLNVFCEWTNYKVKTYLNLKRVKNYSKYASERLSDNAGHLCSSYRTQTQWSGSGYTKFNRVEIDIKEGEITINRKNTKYTTHSSIHKGGDTKPKAYGTAGDCFSWNACSKARKGEFSVDIKGTGAQIDWSKTGDWKAKAWGNGNFIANFKKDAFSVSAKCGGWCGICEPETELYLIPENRKGINTTKS